MTQLRVARKIKSDKPSLLKSPLYTEVQRGHSHPLEVALEDEDEEKEVEVTALLSPGATEGREDCAEGVDAFLPPPPQAVIIRAIAAMSESRISVFIKSIHCIVELWDNPELPLRCYQAVNIQSQDIRLLNGYSLR